MTASKTNRDGIGLVIERMDWYLNLASLLLKQTPVNGSEGLRYELERRVAGLYKALLSYQIASICSYYHHRGLEFLRDVVGLNDWDASLSKIRDAEGILRQDLAQYDMQQIVSQLGRIAISTESIDNKLVGQRQLETTGPQTPPWVVPLGRNQDFVGRESLLSQLLEKIPPGANKDDCQRTAIEGLGGIGKTQIALEAAFRIHETHDCGVFWVPAVDAITFENAYREIGRQLQIKGIDEDKADVKLLVKTTLSQSTHKWLLIIDNADDIELFFAGATPLRDYLPFSRQGSILFTTRNYTAAMKLGISPKNVLRTAEMSKIEAVELLQRSLREDQINDTESMTELLDILEHLPLAIKQASAYMATTGISVTKYLHHCQSSDRTFIKLLSKEFVDLGRYQSIENPIATTWLISFNDISRLNPLAARYLKFMCFLAEKDIPMSLLPPADELEAEEAIGTLKAYAFITERASHNSYDMHRLVRLAMQHWLAEKGELDTCVMSMLQRLNKAFPYPEHENRAAWAIYLPHVLQALALTLDDNMTDDEARVNLLFHAAQSSLILGKYDEAERMYRETLNCNRKTLSDEHLSTLYSMNNLALVLNKQGKYDEAKIMHEQVLTLETKVFGIEHPSTLDSMNNLALVLNNQGKYNEAEIIHRQALDGYKKILGAEHPSTLNSMNNLALVFNSQGKYDEAKIMHQQALALKTKVFGTEHLSTYNSIDNIARVLDNQGKYDEAEIMCRQALAGFKKMLGTDHPTILNNMNSLALILNNQGKYDEAEKMHRQVLEGFKKVLGAEHPSTLTSMNNIALLLDKQGKYDEAEIMYRKILTLKTKTLGAEHPSTLNSMNNFANLLDSQGKYDEAEAMHQQTLTLRTKALGAEHPDTLDSIDNLALVLDNQGKYDEAESMYRQALEGYKKVLGAEHLSTLDSMYNLALVLENQGKHEEAESMQRQALEGYKKVLDAEHQSTLDSIYNLALVLDNQGKHDEAKTMYRQALEGFKKTLGAEHPSTLACMKKLDLMLGRHVTSLCEGSDKPQGACSESIVLNE
jgi:tetratricopeptide (TPR) repeat protein